jgi:hypothetical protein
LHVQRAAAVALIGGKPQVIDKHGEGREGEVMCEHDADTQRLAHGALDGSM